MQKHHLSSSAHYYYKLVMQLLTTIIIGTIIVATADAPTTINSSKSLPPQHLTTVSKQDDIYANSAYLDTQLYNRNARLLEESLSVCIDSLWNTCVGRCGQVMSGAPYVCGCDPMCVAYHDCCIDFNAECARDLPMFNTSLANMFDNYGHFSCISLSRDWKYGVLMVTTCSPSWSNKTAEGNAIIQEACENQYSFSFNPVENAFGLVFKNSFCAICNYISSVKPWEIESYCIETNSGNNSTFLDACTVNADYERLSCGSYRMCSYDINDCPAFDNTSYGDTAVFQEYARLCPRYSKPVFGVQLLNPIAMYKNIHCARCHHVDERQLYCPAWMVVPTSRGSETASTIFVFETGTDADHRTEIPNIPASFAILFYFGHDGSQQTMFSSQSKEWWQTTLEECTSTQIWDPFGDVCRDLYCSTDFFDIDFHCNQMYNITTDYDDGNDIPSNMTAIIQDMDLSIVSVLFDMELDCCIDEERIAIMDEQFIAALATTLNVTVDRFMNFTMYNTSFDDTQDNTTLPQCQKDGASSVLLLGPDPDSTESQPSIEMLMATMSYCVALNQFLLHLDSGINILIRGVQEKVVQYTNSSGNNTEEWCSDGQQLYYTNGEFTPMVINDTPQNTSIYIFINSTGVTYPPGQYIVNILFQGQQRSEVANVTSAAVVCERSNHTNTCLKIMIQQWEYMPLENGSIAYIGNESVPNKVIDPGAYEILPNGDALVCLMLPPYPNNTGGDGTLNHNMVVDLEVQSWLTTILLSLSALAMVITIFTYLSFAELRNPPGWNMINLTTCLLIYHLVYLAGMRPSVTQHEEACYAVAVLLHYFLLSFFFWMNAIAFDIYKTFASSNMVAKAGNMKYLPRYAAYAYGTAMAIVVTCVVLDTDYVAPSVDIGYGDGNVCWIGDSVALAIAFVAPTMYVLICNLFFYVLTVLSIKRIRSKVEMTTTQRNSKEELIIYIRIFTVMGFTWVVGYLSAIPDIPYVAHDVFAYLFIILNGMQGSMIAFAFLVNRKILELYTNSRIVRYLSGRFPIGKCKECKSFVCSCPKPIVRTISNETCQSIILSQSDHQSPEDQRHTSETEINDGFR